MKKHSESTLVTSLRNTLKQRDKTIQAMTAVNTDLGEQVHVLKDKLAHVEEAGRVAELALGGVHHIRSELTNARCEVDMLQRSVATYAEQTHNLRGLLRDVKEKANRWILAAMVGWGLIVVGLGYHAATLL